MHLIIKKIYKILRIIKNTLFNNNYKVYFFELKKKYFVLKNILITSKIDRITYSQYTEDLYIYKLLKNINIGFFIDIGANDPIHFNNTYKFYQMGWRGINIEPDEDKFKLFLKYRKNDLNLNIGISDKPSKLTFFKFKPDTISTFSIKIAEELENQGYKLILKKEIKLFTLKQILQEQKIRSIDFISIDTEGYDQQVIDGNDWTKYRPKIICIEDRTGNDYTKFFEKQHYKKLLFNGLNSFFMDIYLK